MKQTFSSDLTFLYSNNSIEVLTIYDDSGDIQKRLPMSAWISGTTTSYRCAVDSP